MLSSVMLQYFIGDRVCIFTMCCFKELQNYVSGILTVVQNLNSL
jgi:hypothetical protein